MAYDAQSRNRAQSIVVLFRDILHACGYFVLGFALGLSERYRRTHMLQQTIFRTQRSVSTIAVLLGFWLFHSMHLLSHPYKKAQPKLDFFDRPKRAKLLHTDYDIGHTSVRAARCLKAHGLRRIARTARYDKPAIALILLP